MSKSGGDATHDAGRASNKHTFAEGDLLARRYRIVRLIGSGGAGEVYEAIDTSLGVSVALKTLKPNLAGDAIQLERFRREIQNARKVTHLNVCRIFDIGQHSANGRDRFFLTMELLAGRSLAQRLENGPAYETEEALAVATQIAEGLQAAHDAGVVHRDLKPANIMLLPPLTGRAVERFVERAVIMDFGLALSDQQGDIRLTQSGELVGTPDYMAPEQAELGPARPATDVYAFGLILYEMLTRIRPFETGGTPLATVLLRRRQAPRPPRDHLPTLDATWNATILRCLERQPERRFQRPADVIAALTARRPGKKT